MPPRVFSLSAAVRVSRCCCADSDSADTPATRFSSGSVADTARHRACASRFTKACGRLMIPSRVSFIAMSDWIWLVPS